ncbi:MAG: hypothetical protein RL141_193 [Candidatus Parcubacteria bacterium]
MQKIAIQKTLGVPAACVMAGDYNLWVGVSDSPLFHEPGVLEDLVEWALAHTCQELLVWIPADLYAINHVHIDGKSRQAAMKSARQVEESFRARVARLLESSRFTAEQRACVHVADGSDMLTSTYNRRQMIFHRSFSDGGVFRERVLGVAEAYLRARHRSVTPQLTEAVSAYQLGELPMFMGPVQMVGSDTTYAVEVYPGSGLFDQLVRDIVEGAVFPAVTEQLKIPVTPFGVVEVRRG